MTPTQEIIGRIRKIFIPLVTAFFTYTFVTKALDLTSFSLNVAKTGLFTGGQVDFVVYTVLLVELTCILGLLLKENLGIILSLCMMSTFTAYIIFLHISHKYEVCGCGGILNGLSFSNHLMINLGIMAILVFLNLTKKD